MGFKNFSKILFPPSDDVIEEEELYSRDDDYVEEERKVRPADTGYTPRGVSVTTGGSSIEMKVVTPKSYDTVTQIADLLLEKKTVLMNLENTNRETARRLIDFLSGVAYALGGGGRFEAGAAYVEDATVDEVVERLKPIIDKLLDDKNSTGGNKQ